MTTVLITRPRRAAEDLAQELRHQGFTGIVEPMLEIEPLEAPMPDISSVQAVMITSANAMEALTANDDATEALLGLPCFCVGPRTAESAHAFGFKNIRNATGGGNELAKLISETLSDKGRAVLHIAAQDADSKAQEELTRRGYQVLSWRVYEARPVTEFTPGTAKLFEQRKLDAILVFSIRTAQVLGALLEQNRLQACCESLSAIGISMAVADALRPFPWRKLAAANTPTEEAVIECLKQLHPVS